jgi:hypothetical protein
MMDTVNRADYSPLQTDADILDDVLDQITTIKTDSSSFFWSDMIPSKGTLTQKSYTLKSGINASNYPLTKVYDFTTANYDSVLVYLTRTVNGTKRTMQLIRNKDYTVSATEKHLYVNTYLMPNDTITVKEYSQTYGSYVPSTPTKMK